LLEKEDEIGGLGGGFKIGQQRYEKFYHHWFKNDQHIIELVKDLGSEDKLFYRATQTGIYLDNKIFKFCTPFDVLRFKPLSWLSRIRLGLLVLLARRVRDWKQLESRTAEEWLVKLCGREAYGVIWEPLLRGKFGPFAPEISAVWFWNKLVLRGGSRSKLGAEMLAYYRDGFGGLAEAVADEIRAARGVIRTGTAAEALIVEDGRVRGVRTADGKIDAQAVVATPALPIIADLVEPHVPREYVESLRRIRYLANVCLVLELSRSLSGTYWLNVCDDKFPFIGVIEHTNLQPIESCGGRHIVYLSAYLTENSELYQMKEEEIFEFSLPYIKRMFSKFDRSWVRSYYVWKACYAQPVVERDYSQLIPSQEAPVKGLYIATMAQVYPEDRGTNYAVGQGRQVGRIVAGQIGR
jgi:protoporphyrinogen oxidase